MIGISIKILQFNLENLYDTEVDRLEEIIIKIRYIMKQKIVKKLLEAMNFAIYIYIYI